MTIAASPSPRVVVLGAGMSGILMGIKLLQAGFKNFRIYEKAAKLGGTWRENTYPNVACDVPGRGYSYSFELNPEWNWRFGRGDEIQRYLERVAQKYGVVPYITFNNAVTEARWDGERWQLQLTDGSRDAAEVLVSAVGGLHVPRMPDIPGLDSFAGAAFHSARWNQSIDIRDKRVGVVGTGSTSAQIVPGIVDKVRELYLFQRTAQWMLPVPDRKYSERSKRLQRTYPWLAKWNHDLWLRIADTVAGALLGNRFVMGRMEAACRRNLASVRDPELRRRLTPSYPVGCKRIVVSEDFYPAIQRPNAHLVTDGIARIVPEGILTTTGETIGLDVLVLATGFYPYKPTADVIGADGRTLDETWGGSPLVHRSVGVPGFPNYFVIFGPYSPLGNMSIIENSEIQVGYILQCIDWIAKGRVRSLTPRRDVAERQKQEIREALKKTAWQGGCQSWYLDVNGEAVSWPFTMKRFREDLRIPVLAEYETT